MKLRNKKTGEIVKVVGYVKTGDDRMFFRFEDDNGTYKKEYNSLAELEREWEDVPEEPSKTIWQIKDSGELQDFEEDDFSDGYIESSKSIGNYFETQEEAEKAVEKLKAWKRLKDKGFKFTGYDTNYGQYRASFIFEKEAWATETEPDLDLLFGGEE